MVKLAFVCTPNQISTTDPTKSPIASIKNNPRQNFGQTYLAASFLDFDDGDFSPLALSQNA